MLLLAFLSLFALWKPPVATTPPPGSSPTANPQAIWQDGLLSLKLSLLPGQSEARTTRLRLCLTNSSLSRCWIPGTFCLEGEEADWWSHGVRIKVEGLRSGSWRLAPSYGERALHEHAAFTNVIQPLQTLSWEFCLDGLVEVPTHEVLQGWERARGPLRLTCELSQPGHKLFSNPVVVGVAGRASRGASNLAS